MSSPAATAPSSSGATQPQPQPQPQPTEQQGGSRERRMESLGWLTESAVMPKKHKAIEGVGAASILDLKAQLYRTQEEARNPTAPSAVATAASGGEFRRAKIRPAPADPLGAKNSGVESRAHKDKLELKAVKDGSASYAALEKKAELYEKLSRGELPDEEDKEKYCVDFFQKSFNRVYEPQMPESSHRATDDAEPVNDHEDSMPNAKPLGLGRAGTTIDRDEHKRFVREVHEEVTEARQKASTVRSRRQEQDAARREKLRQAYLKKRLEKLIAEKQASSATAAATPTAADTSGEAKEVTLERAGTTKWLPHLYINTNDYICCYYTDAAAGTTTVTARGGGGGGSESSRAAGGDGGMGKPGLARMVTVSKGPTNFLDAHGLQQWWADDVELQVALNHSKLIDRQLRSLYAAQPASPQVSP